MRNAGTRSGRSIQSEPAITSAPGWVCPTVKLHILRGYRKRAKITDSDRRASPDRPRVVTGTGPGYAKLQIAQGNLDVHEFKWSTRRAIRSEANDVAVGVLGSTDATGVAATPEAS